MAFRSDEEKDKGLEKAFQRLVPRGGSQEERDAAKQVIYDIIDKYGPVVEGYPSWHPLVSTPKSPYSRYPFTTPGNDNGYAGVDHTIYFANAFLTCPYDGGKEILSSIDSRPRHHLANITAEKLSTVMYNSNATPVLVTCEWDEVLNFDKTIPKRIAIGLMLEEEIPAWRYAEVAETWESMKPYFLGRPHGARSSLFVDQETGQAMKAIWNAIIYTGMYGPIKV